MRCAFLTSTCMKGSRETQVQALPPAEYVFTVQTPKSVQKQLSFPSVEIYWG